MTYPATLCCDVVTKLLAIDRLMDFSRLEVYNSRWTLLRRVSVAIIVLGNVVGMCGNTAAAVFFSKSAVFQESQARYFGNNETARQTENAKALAALAQGTQIAALHIGFEVIMLILIVIAVFFIGLACVRRISMTRSLQSLEMKRIAKPGALWFASNSNDQLPLDQQRLKQQIIITCSAVFVSFVLRAAYSTLFAIANALHRDLGGCSNIDKQRCSDCYDIPYFIQLWMLYSPAWLYSIAIISQPVTLMIALWGMTSDRMLSIMKAQTHNNV